MDHTFPFIGTSEGDLITPYSTKCLKKNFSSKTLQITVIHLACITITIHV